MEKLLEFLKHRIEHWSTEAVPLSLNAAWCSWFPLLLIVVFKEEREEAMSAIRRMTQALLADGIAAFCALVRRITCHRHYHTRRVGGHWNAHAYYDATFGNGTPPLSVHKQLP